MEYESESHAKEILLLEERAKADRMIRYALIVGILLISAVAIFKTQSLRIKTNKQKMLLQEGEQLRLKNEVDFKVRELASTTIFITQKNDILTEIQDMLKTSYDRVDPETGTNFKKLGKFIDQNINLDDDWNQFKLHFDNVHTGFFDRLSKTYSSLTDHEVKLCAYLKMNLSSKEIARLSNISAEGVKKSRQRLRKKLNVSSETNLIKFISEV